MIKNFFKAVLIIWLVLVAVVGYNAYKASGEGISVAAITEQLQDSEKQELVVKYGRKAMSLVTSFASSVLNFLGFEVELGDTEDIMDAVVNASDKMDEAINRLK